MDRQHYVSIRTEKNYRVTYDVNQEYAIVHTQKNKFVFK